MKANHDQGLAAVFSFLFNGLGQIYNGHIAKGLFIISFSTLSMLVLIFGSILIGFHLIGTIASVGFLIFGFVLFIAGLILICIIGIYSIFDAYRTALRE